MYSTVLKEQEELHHRVARVFSSTPRGVDVGTRPRLCVELIHSNPKTALTLLIIIFCN
jgi:hypothetical protein